MFILGRPEGRQIALNTWTGNTRQWDTRRKQKVEQVAVTIADPANLGKACHLESQLLRQRHL